MYYLSGKLNVKEKDYLLKCCGYNELHYIL